MTLSTRAFQRAFPLEDISVRSVADGRIVDAYAAVFNQRLAVADWEGEYDETIDPHAFDVTIAKRGLKFAVLFNHGQTIHGGTSDRFSLPIGKPLEVRADRKGVFTSTRYANTPLADEVLELIKADAITSQSFGGTWVRSDWTETKGAKARRSVRRMEIAMRDYGPATFAVYESAAIVGVRSRDEIAAQLAQWSPEERAELAKLLAQSENPEPDSSLDPPQPPAASPGVETLEPFAQELELLRARMTL